MTTFRPSRRLLLGAGLTLPVLGSLPLMAQEPEDAPAPEPDPDYHPADDAPTLLILGGTRFLGPAVVQSAKARGYRITLWNRGRSNPHLFPELEKLVGDRDSGDLSALEGRKWDLVVDTSCYLPSHAAKAAEVLGDNVGHYVLISTISVYENGGGEQYDVDETAAVAPISDEDVAKVTSIREVMTDGGIYYGPLKALCEAKLEELMPGRVTSLRPGVICGKDDPSDRLPYWVERVRRGGEILCPAPRDQDFQFTDVDDLADWSMDLGAAGKGGLFNAIGFDAKVTLEEFLHGCKIVLGTNDASFTWASEEFLLENEVRPFSELPFWLPAEWSHHYVNDALIAAGATFRPIAETIEKTNEWHLAERGKDYEWRWYGMQPEREAELLAAWHGRDAEPAEEPEVEPDGEAPGDA